MYQDHHTPTARRRDQQSTFRSKCTGMYLLRGSKTALLVTVHRTLAGIVGPMGDFGESCEGALPGPVPAQPTGRTGLRLLVPVATLIGSWRLAGARLWPGPTVLAGAPASPRLHPVDPADSSDPADSGTDIGTHADRISPGPLEHCLRRAAGVVRAAGAAVERRPFDEEWFDVDGLRLHYETHGHGNRVVLLLHGILFDSQMNRRLAADLADHGSRVVLLDLPGHGRSDKPRHAAAHRMDAYADVVIALLDHLGVDRAIVGGVSLGANVALYVACRNSDRVAGLVVEMPVLEWAVPSAAMAFVPLLVTTRVARGPLRAFSATARRLPSTRVAVLDSIVSALRADPDEVAAVLHGVLVGPVAPTVADRRAIHHRALVIGHRLDFIHPFADAAHLARQLPGATLIEANSIAELRIAPARLTKAIADFVAAAWDDA